MTGIPTLDVENCSGEGGDRAEELWDLSPLGQRTKATV